MKSYNQRLYPNPFRYRKLKTIKNNYEIFEEIREKFKSFLPNKFSEIDEYFDEFGELKSELRLIRLIRNSIKNKFSSYIKDIKSFENYQRNLRYLDIPVQPLVDKEGFEIQSLSSDLLEDILEEIDTGMTFIYDYCADVLPETIDLWEDYARLNLNDFPIISHDYLLERTYRRFDRIFYKIQKGLINVSNWGIAGDVNTRVLKIVKPKLDVNDIIYGFKTILECIVSLVILILIIQYIINRFKPILSGQKRKLLRVNPKTIFRKIKRNLSFKKFRIQQKIRNLRIELNLLNYKLNLKYRLLRLIFNRTIL